MLDQADKVRGISDQLHLANLEIALLNHKIKEYQAELSTTRGHVNKLWGFIAIRHRIDIPAENGSIRELLQKAEGR